MQGRLVVSSHCVHQALSAKVRPWPPRAIAHEATKVEVMRTFVGKGRVNGDCCVYFCVHCNMQATLFRILQAQASKRTQHKSAFDSVFLTAISVRRKFLQTNCMRNFICTLSKSGQFMRVCTRHTIAANRLAPVTHGVDVSGGFGALRDLLAKILAANGGCMRRGWWSVSERE